MDPLMPPPPIRRIVVEAPHVAVPPPELNGHGPVRVRPRVATHAVERMRVEELTIA